MPAWRLLHSYALQMVLLVLVKLLAEPAVQDKAPAVLSQLLSGNIELQKAAADADAASKLAAFLCREDCRAPLQASSLPHMLGSIPQVAKCLVVKQQY